MARTVSAVTKINKHDIYAKYAENDQIGRNIVRTYATKQELSGSAVNIKNVISGVSSTIYNELSAYESATDAKIESISGKSVSGLDYLSAAISAEVVRAVSSENRIEHEIKNEIVELSGEIYGELSALSGNLGYYVNTLSAAIDTERERALSAETDLYERIGELSGGNVRDVVDEAGNSFVTDYVAVIPSATAAHAGIVKISTILI